MQGLQPWWSTHVVLHKRAGAQLRDGACGPAEAGAGAPERQRHIDDVLLLTRLRLRADLA